MLVRVVVAASVIGYVSVLFFTRAPMVWQGVMGVAIAALVVVLVLAIRAYRTSASEFVRYCIATVALGIALLVLPGILSPVVGYGLLCLALGSKYLFDLLHDERARRRRVAPLTPRPVAEVVPTIWIALAAVSALMLTPYITLGEERAAAFLVGVCALGLAAIAWRITTAPVQLEGEGNPHAERMHDRAMRYRKAGLSCVIAVGTIMVFVDFVYSGLPFQRIFSLLLMGIWAGLALWVILHSRHLDHVADSLS